MQNAKPSSCKGEGHFPDYHSRFAFAKSEWVFLVWSFAYC